MRSGSSAESGAPVLPRDGRSGIPGHPSLGARLIGIFDRNLHILFPLPALCLVVGAVEVQVRRVEEPHLQALHGDAYRAYCRSVGRFVPRLGRAV